MNKLIYLRRRIDWRDLVNRILVVICWLAVLGTLAAYAYSLSIL